MSKKILYVLDDNKHFLQQFREFDLKSYDEDTEIKTFYKVGDFYDALENDSAHEKYILLDYIIGNIKVSDILDDIKRIQLKNYKIWLYSGQAKADVESVIKRYDLQKQWFSKPVNIEDIVTAILELKRLSNTEVIKLLENVLLSNNFLQTRLIDKEGKIRNSYGIQQITNDSHLRGEIFQRSQKEHIFSEDRFLVLAEGDENESIKYIETINMHVKNGYEEYLWQIFFDKEEPKYSFQDTEKYFIEFANKVLNTLRYAGFTRARLYTLKYFTQHEQCSSSALQDGFVEKQNGKYFAQAMVGHTSQEEKKFLGKGFLFTKHEKDVLEAVQKEFQTAQSKEQLIYKILDVDDDKDSPWYDCFDGKGYDKYLFIPIFDKDGNVIMAIKCDRYNITNSGASDYNSSDITDEEVEKTAKILLRATNLLRSEYKQKRYRFYEKYQSKLLQKLSLISPDTKQDETLILERIIKEVYTTLKELDTKQYKRPQLGAMWIGKIDDNRNFSVLKDFGNLPESLKKHTEEHYRILQHFLQCVSMEHHKLNIVNFTEDNSWKQYIQEYCLENSECRKWYESGFASIYFRAIYVNQKLKAVLIFYSKEPYYLSSPIDTLIDIAVEKCRLTLEIHSKNKERVFLSRELVHDLKSPLNTIKTHIDTLKKSNEGLAKEFALATNHLQEEIDDILMLSRLDNDKVSVELQTIDLELFLQESFEHFRVLAEHKKLNYTLEIDDGVPKEFQSDKVLLQHILSNLLSNAVKYTNFGDVILKAYTENKKLIISVQDTGKGIEKQKQKNIYELFSNRSNEYENTGMGLYIVKMLTQKLGYEIKLESEVDKGSEFKIITTIDTNVQKVEKLSKIEYKAHTLDEEQLREYLQSLDITQKAKKAYKSGQIPIYQEFIDELSQVIDKDYKEYIEILQHYLDDFAFKALDKELQQLIKEN